MRRGVWEGASLWHEGEDVTRIGVWGKGALGGGYLEGQLIREWVSPSESVWRNQSVVGLTSGLHGSGGGNVGEKRRVVSGRAHCTLTHKQTQAHTTGFTFSMTRSITRAC